MAIRCEPCWTGQPGREPHREVVLRKAGGQVAEEVERARSDVVAGDRLAGRLLAAETRRSGRAPRPGRSRSWCPAAAGRGRCCSRARGRPRHRPASGRARPSSGETAYGASMWAAPPPWMHGVAALGPTTATRRIGRRRAAGCRRWRAARTTPRPPGGRARRRRRRRGGSASERRATAPAPYRPRPRLRGPRRPRRHRRRVQRPDPAASVRTRSRRAIERLLVDLAAPNRLRERGPEVAAVARASRGRARPPRRRPCRGWRASRTSARRPSPIRSRRIPPTKSTLSEQWTPLTRL